MDSLSQCMHTWLLFIYRFPREYAYQNECSLGSSCKWHPTSLIHCSLKSELWQQGKGNKIPKPSPLRVGNHLFLSQYLTEAFQKLKNEEKAQYNEVVLLHVDGQLTAFQSSTPTPSSQEQFKHFPH